MRVLVTGGGGFIGAWIVCRLAQAGITPVVFDMHGDRSKNAEVGGASLARQLEWITGDIGETEAVVAAGRGCEVVVHLAGLLTPACRENPLLCARVNLIGTLNAFLCARAHGMRSVVYMSSAGVFGADGGAEPRPATLYGAFKLGAEHSARAFFEEDGISSIGFRPFVVYGPGREVGLSAGPSRACRAAARGEAYAIPFTGPIDMIHVNDVARIFLTAVQTPLEGAHVLNLVGCACDTGEVVDEIRRLVPGARIDAAGPAMPIRSPTADAALAGLFPSFQPLTLSEGLAATIDHYRKEAQQ